MEASGFKSLVGPSKKKLVVPFGDGGLFFSYWADIVGEVGSVLRGSKVALPRAAGFLFMLGTLRRYSLTVAGRFFL